MNESKTVKIKGLNIGGPKTLICLPLIAESDFELLTQAAELKKMKPDLIEWRVDYYEDCGKKEKVLSALNDLSHVLDDLPLIFTLRTIDEGGKAEISNEIRKEIIKMSIKSGYIDFIDIELSNEKKFIEDMRELCLANNTKLILSYHNFSQTPCEKEIIEILVKGEQLDGDIVKVALMPNSKDDVLILMKAVNEAEKILRIPIIAISMGELGQITRIACRSMGSAITFAAASILSAPGQMGYYEIKNILNTLEGGNND